MKKILAALFALLFALHAIPAQATLVTQEISYMDGDVKLAGYLAYDDAVKTSMPGVLVIHEWWGHNHYARMRAEQLADLGYVAFALDMYGEGKDAANPKEAEALSKPFYDDRSLMDKRAMAGLEVLKSQPQVDKTRLGVIGYCFGGAVALEMARHGEDVKGVVSFHGNLSTPEPAEAGRVKAQVLALNGGADKFVSKEEQDNFAAEMKAAGVNYKMVVYPAATHAFTNPDATLIGQRFNMPIEYDAEAAKAAWEEMKTFFARLFKEQPVIAPSP